MEFGDGEVIELTAHVIAEYMYESYDDKGNGNLLMESMVEYWKNYKEMSVADQRSVLLGRPVMRNSTDGWQICVQWKDGLTS